VYHQEQKPYERFALAAARYFQAAAAAPAPSIIDKPPSMGALFGSSGGGGCACTRFGNETCRNSSKTQQKIARKTEDLEHRDIFSIMGIHLS